LELSNEQRHIINSIIRPVLEPLKLATAMLSSEENLAASANNCAGLLDVDEECDNHQTVVGFHSELVRQLKSRFSVNGGETTLFGHMSRSAFQSHELSELRNTITLD